MSAQVPPGDLSAFRLRLLATLADLDGATGQETKSRVEDYCGEGFTNGKLYQHLNALEEMDLIDKGFLDGRTNLYTITDHGRAVLEREREYLTTHPEATHE